MSQSGSVRICTVLGRGFFWFFDANSSQHVAEDLNELRKGVCPYGGRCTLIAELGIVGFLSLRLWNPALQMEQLVCVQSADRCLLCLIHHGCSYSSTKSDAHLQLELLDAALSAVRKELKNCLGRYLPEVPWD